MPTREEVNATMRNIEQVQAMSAEERVSAGAAAMDETAWKSWYMFDGIDLDDLNMGDGCACIVGQAVVHTARSVEIANRATDLGISWSTGAMGARDSLDLMLSGDFFALVSTDSQIDWFMDAKEKELAAAMVEAMGFRRRSSVELIALGFLDGAGVTYAELQTAWETEIKLRRIRNAVAKRDAEFGR